MIDWDSSCCLLHVWLLLWNNIYSWAFLNNFVINLTYFHLNNIHGSLPCTFRRNFEENKWRRKWTWMTSYNVIHTEWRHTTSYMRRHFFFAFCVRNGVCSLIYCDWLQNTHTHTHTYTYTHWHWNTHRQKHFTHTYSCIYIYTQTQAHTHICRHICTHIYTYKEAYTQAHTLAHKRTHNIYSNTWKYAHIYLQIDTYPFTYKDRNSYTYTHINTH